MKKRRISLWLIRSVALALLVAVMVLAVVTTVPDVPVSVDVPGRDAVFNAEFERLIHDAEVADRVVVDEAIAEIDRYFDAKERKLEPFLDELYSLKTKLKMGWYLARDIRFRPFGEQENQSFRYVSMLALRPVREGTHLPDFIEGLFARYFGGRAEISQMLEQISGSVSRELAFNNERLANEIGVLAAADDQGLGDAADRVGAQAGFHDKAGALAMTIVNHTTGIQFGSEIFGIFMADSIAVSVISYLVAEGVIVISGVAKGLVTFGVAAVVALAVDLVANKLAKDNLRPKVVEALEKRHRETITAFRHKLQQALRAYQMERRRTVRRLLADCRS